MHRQTIPNTYRPGPFGAMPLYWRDEQSGVLEEAVMRYLERRPITLDQLELLADYCRHFINAPCWTQSCFGAFDKELAALREEAKTMQSRQDLDRFFDNALALGIDPF